jgi:hypothetical protein
VSVGGGASRFAMPAGQDQDRSWSCFGYVVVGGAINMAGSMVSTKLNPIQHILIVRPIAGNRPERRLCRRPHEATAEKVIEIAAE